MALALGKRLIGFSRSIAKRMYGLVRLKLYLWLKPIKFSFTIPKAEALG